MAVNKPDVMWLRPSRANSAVLGHAFLRRSGNPGAHARLSRIPLPTPGRPGAQSPSASISTGGCTRRETYEYSRHGPRVYRTRYTRRVSAVTRLGLPGKMTFSLSAQSVCGCVRLVPSSLFGLGVSRPHTGHDARKMAPMPGRWPPVMPLARAVALGLALRYPPARRAHHAPATLAATKPPIHDRRHPFREGDPSNARRSLAPIGRANRDEFKCNRPMRRVDAAASWQEAAGPDCRAPGRPRPVLPRCGKCSSGKSGAHRHPPEQ